MYLTFTVTSLIVKKNCLHTVETSFITSVHSRRH